MHEHAQDGTLTRGADGALYLLSPGSCVRIDESEGSKPDAVGSAVSNDVGFHGCPSGAEDHASARIMIEATDDHAAARIMIEAGDHSSARIMVEPGDHEASRIMVEAGDGASARIMVEPGDHGSSKIMVDPGDSLIN